MFICDQRPKACVAVRRLSSSEGVFCGFLVLMRGCEANLCFLQSPTLDLLPWECSELSEYRWQKKQLLYPGWRSVGYTGLIKVWSRVQCSWSIMVLHLIKANHFYISEYLQLNWIDMSPKGGLTVCMCLLSRHKVLVSSGHCTHQKWKGWSGSVPRLAQRHHRQEEGPGSWTGTWNRWVHIIPHKT